MKKMMSVLILSGVLMMGQAHAAPMTQSECYGGVTSSTGTVTNLTWNPASGHCQTQEAMNGCSYGAQWSAFNQYYECKPAPRSSERGS